MLIQRGEFNYCHFSFRYFLAKKIKRVKRLPQRCPGKYSSIISFVGLFCNQEYSTNDINGSVYIDANDFN